jgi:hypothetical protein
VIAVLHGLSRDVKYLRDEVGGFNKRIDVASKGSYDAPLYAEPPISVAPAPDPVVRQAASPWVGPMGGLTTSPWDVKDVKDPPASGRSDLDRPPVLPHMMEPEE